MTEGCIARDLADGKLTGRTYCRFFGGSSRGAFAEPLRRFGVTERPAGLGAPWALGYRWWVVSPREEPATKVATM
jgi:hypothetical protein